MKKIFTAAIALFICNAAFSQTTLEECQAAARQNYPLIKKYDLIKASTQYSVSNAAKAYLPQISAYAQATYQNETAAFPDQIKQAYQQMGLNIHALNKDQYKLGVDVSQTIWDGGAARAEQKSAEAEDAVQQSANDMDLYAVRERINSLFFGALTAAEQAKQNELRQTLLRSNLNRIKAYLANGAAMQCDADVVEAELLAAEQQRTQIDATHEAYIEMLSIFTGLKIDSLAMPEFTIANVAENNRIELQYFNKLKEKYDSQADAVRASTKPRIGLTFQGYYGNQGLNLFKNMTEKKWTLNYIAGIKLQWNFGGFYTKRNKLRQIETAQNSVDVQRETFLFNTKMQTAQQQIGVKQKQDVMKNDARIISLREAVRKAYEAKLANGIIETTDLLREITNESNARLAQAQHRIELLKEIYDLKYTVNN